MPRKLHAKLDLDDRDPDGFKFPSASSSRRSSRNKGKSKEQKHQNRIKSKELIFRESNDIYEEEEDELIVNRCEMRVMDDWAKKTFPRIETEVLKEVKQCVLEDFDVEMLQAKTEERFRKFCFSMQSLMEDMGFSSSSTAPTEVDEREEKEKEEEENEKERANCFFLQLPNDMREVIFQKAGLQAVAACAATCREMRAAVSAQRAKVNGLFVIPRKMSSPDGVRQILCAYPGISGISSRNIFGLFNSKLTGPRILDVLIEATHTHCNVRKLDLRKCFGAHFPMRIDELIQCFSCRIASIDFSQSDGCPECQYSNYLPSRADFYPGLKIWEIAQIIYEWIASGVVVSGNNVHIKEVIFSGGNLSQFDVMFFLYVFKGLKRLNVTRSVKYYSDIDFGDDEDSFTKASSDEGMIEKLLPCQIEYLNLSRLSTKIFSLQFNIWCN